VLEILIRIEAILNGVEKVNTPLISVLSIVAPLRDTKLHTPKSNVKARTNH